VNKLTFRHFNEAVHDFDLVSEKDTDIRLIEGILLGSRFLPENPQLFPIELLSRFSRAPGAHSPAICRMVAEAALMVLLSSERSIVPLYPCISPSSVRVRRCTGYGPTHVLAVNTLQMQQQGAGKEAGSDSSDSDTLAVVWGERSGLQVWRCSSDHDMFQYYYLICNQVRDRELYAIK